MDLKNMIKSANFWLAIVLFINLSLFAYLGHKKYLLFVDEGFTYSAANGAEVRMPNIDEVELCQSNPAIFQKQFSVQTDEIFRYRNIKKNMVDHPPLYFFMFHAIHSLFPNVFDKWIGLVFNFIVFLLAQFVLYTLSREFLSAKKSFLPVILYGFSVAAICTTLYVRNYILFTMFLNLFLLFTVRLIKAFDSNDEQNYRKNLIYFLVMLFVGVMTHFYFLITAFIICAGIDFILLWHKEYKKLIFFTFSALGTVGLCPLLFSCVRRNLMGGHGSREASNVLYENIINRQFDLLVWDNFIKQDVLGNIFSNSFSLSEWAIIVVFFYLVYRLVKRQKVNNAIVLLAVSLIVSVFIISAVLPMDIKFSGTGKRYFFHLVPLFVLMFVLVTDKIFAKYRYSFVLQMVLVLFLLIGSGYRPNFSIYLLLDKSIEGSYAQQLKDKTLWIRWQKNDEKWKKVEPALFSFYAKNFVIFRNFEDECYQKMILDESARQHTALMLENKGKSDEDCEKVVGYKPIFSRWSFCAYLPQ